MATALKTMATVKTTKEVKLQPRVSAKLRLKLSSYQTLAEQIKALKLQKKNLTADIGKLRAETGEQSLSIDGFTITEVRGTTSKIDQKKLIELGCAAAWIEEATTRKPKRPYEKITCPGDEEDGDDE